MALVLRSCVQRLTSVSSKISTQSFHTTATRENPRYKKYAWTPWPYHTGLKVKRYKHVKGRPGYQTMRRDFIPKPGSEEGQISGPYCKKFQAVVLEEFGKIFWLFARQCEVYAAQRVRRFQQVVRMYGLWYNREVVGGVIMKVGSGFRSSVPGSLMAFVGGAVFAMDKRELVISDNEVEKCFDELGRWSMLIRENRTDAVAEWESVATQPTCSVWQNRSTAEYRAIGTFLDVPARIFYKTQLDLAYRKQWDKLVIKLDVIDRDEGSETEILQWVSRYPFPLSPREYIYERRHKLDEQRNAIVVISKSCDGGRCPANPKYIRVNTYYSALLIRPHRNFDENGFDYVLSYVDDPETIVPKFAVQYAAKSSLPEFMLKLHAAAKSLMLKRKQAAPSQPSIPLIETLKDDQIPVPSTQDNAEAASPEENKENVVNLEGGGSPVNHPSGETINAGVHMAAP